MKCGVGVFAESVNVENGNAFSRKFDHRDQISLFGFEGHLTKLLAEPGK